MRVLLTAALALLTLAGPASAQSALPPSAPFSGAAPSDAVSEGPTTVTPQLVSALGSASAAVRARALHAVTVLAYSSEGADLRPALPALLDVFRTDPDERFRVLALRALETTDDGAVMTALRGEVGRPASPALQRLLFSVLLEHYGVDALRNDADVVALAQSIRASSRL